MKNERKQPSHRLPPLLVNSIATIVRACTETDSGGLCDIPDDIVRGS